MNNRPLLISVAQYEDELKDGTVTIFDVIDVAHRLGADGVELRRETWTNHASELESARARIEELGLLVTYATHATLFNDNEDGYAQVRADLDAAKALGSSQLRIFQGPLPATDDDAEWAKAQAIVDYAAERDMVVALENYVGEPGGTLAEIKSVLDRIDSPALGTNIDIGNYDARGEDVPHAVRTVGSRAVSTHLKDKTATPGEPPVALGAGVLPLGEIMAELNALPQRIIYCFEFRGGDDAEDRIRQSLNFLHN